MVALGPSDYQGKTIRRARFRRALVCVGIVLLVVVVGWVVGVVSGVIRVQVTGVTWSVVENGSVVPGYAFTGSCTTLAGSYHPWTALQCNLIVWGPRGAYLSSSGAVSASPPFSAGTVPPPPCTGYGCPMHAPSLYVVITTPAVPGSYWLNAQVTG